MTDYLRDRLVSGVGAQYTVESEIGRGSSGVVYRATDARLHRAVAIKVLPPELAFNGDVKSRFIREAQTAAQLSHPNIVPIYAVDDRDGLVYFVMGLVEGESIGALSTRSPIWSIDRAVHVLRDVADALAYAHSRGVIHRDIKPDNILIERATGRALVTDFGIARAMEGDARLTATGATVGTPAYMSPEQALGEGELDGRSDVYSLGVVGYHMLSGDTPFHANSAPSMLMKHVSEPPRPIREKRPDTPAYLAISIDRALAKKPADRWASAAELRDALAGANLAAMPRRGAAPPPQPLLPPPPSPQTWNVPPQPLQPPIDYPVPMAMPPMFAGYQSPPPGLNRRQLKEWRRQQRRMEQEQRRLAKLQLVASVQGMAVQRRRDKPLWRKVARYRSSVLTFAVVAPILFIINAANGGAPWCLIPDGILLLGVFLRAESLWSEGIGPFEALGKGLVRKLRSEEETQMAAQSALASGRPPAYQPGARAAYPMAPVDAAAGLVSPEVLAGAYGSMVRGAVNDAAHIREVVASLTGVEKDLLPDIGPTVDGLLQRVLAISTTLTRLDSDVSGSSLGALDERIERLRRETETPDRERRMALLERQRSSLHDLLSRRQTLANQLESAVVALQNLKFDLLKLRSAGVDAAIHDATGATQEARAVSKEIGRIMQVADDLRKL